MRPLASLIFAAALALPALAQADPATQFATYCQACHGATGAGDGPAAAALSTPPRNFTDTAVMSQLTDEELAEIINNGKAGTPMTAWGSALGGDAAVSEMVSYIRTMAASE